MRTIVIAINAFVLFAFCSCSNDTKVQEEATTEIQAEVQSLDSISNNLEVSEQEINEAVDDLDAALDELED